MCIRDSFGIWMAVGIVVYFLYSRTHSRLAQTPEEPTTPASPAL